MKEFNKITYFDLKLEALKNRLPNLVGRTEEMRRLTRLVGRRIDNNSLIVGAGGIGKTTLVQAWVKKLHKAPSHSHIKFIQLRDENFYNITPKHSDAINYLPKCVLFIDDFGAIVYNKPTNFQNLKLLISPLLENPDTQVILCLKPYEYEWVAEEDPAFLNWFETITLKTQPFEEQIKILELTLIKLKTKIKAPESVLKLIVEFTEKFTALGQLPDSAIKILDECLVQTQTIGKSEITEQQVQLVIADKTGIPLSQLSGNEKQLLKTLSSGLNQTVISQENAINKISAVIQRAKLGLRNPNRPLGSFLILGPSGVGKTEVAKQLAKQIFGKRENFIRIDMSEFGQEHTVHRLIGAPPGYVGYDEGGGLTSSVKAEPYSLILLDEIEKAHKKIFDVFLQILDDGRLTSGQGETVDFTQTIVMATSNLAVDEIIQGFEAKADIHSEEFLKTKIMPALTQAFRLEFLNRFDNIVIFNPLTTEDLIKIAGLEIKKIEQRVKKHNLGFNIDQTLLAQKILTLTDHRFGARVVKRFVEETCENLIVKALLK
jgi:ATP-dependent Clp protease ATP-binding subunit ClpC